jgi:hypothetical protein
MVPVNRWLSSRFNLLSSAIIGVVGLIAVLTNLDASLAGFALTFAGTITGDVSSGLISLGRSLSVADISFIHSYCLW